MVINGIKIGTLKIGNKAPLVVARDIIAPMIVELVAIPKLAVNKTRRKILPYLKVIWSKKIIKNTTDIKFISNEKTTL